MKFAEGERAALAALLAEVGPDAPTTIRWTTHDLAAHLWVRENDPLALPGIGLSAFAWLTDARMQRAKEKYSYAELVRRFKRPRIWTKPMSAANAVEFFVHRLDVLRADAALKHAPPSSSDEDVLWNSAKLISMRLRKAPFVVVLEREDTGETRRISSGSEAVTLIGRPSELVLFLTGRQAYAHLRYIGTTGNIDKLKQLKLGL